MDGSSAELVTGGQVVPSLDMDRLIVCRDKVVAGVGQAMQILTEAANLAKEAGIGFPDIEVSETYTRTGRYRVGGVRNDDAVEIARKSCDAGAWQRLLNDSGLRTFMDAKARKQWDDALQRGDFPPLTVDNIASTFRQMHDTRGEMFERGVIAVFKGLSWNYKTNLPQKFGKRLVLRCVTSQVMRGERCGHPNHRTCDELDDLTRVLCLLEGKPEPDHRNGWHHLIWQARESREMCASSEYMTVKLHKNGNGHVTFLRMQPVYRMNEILAKHFPGALPAPRD